MTAHSDFINTLMAAAQRGDDPATVLRDAQDHLASCPECRRAFARFMTEVFAEDELMLMVVRHLDDTDHLETPTPHPPIDDSFLGSTPILWRATSASRMHTTQSRSVREWAGPTLTVSVGRRRQTATFRDLPPLLTSALSVPSEPLIATRRRGATSAHYGQTLTLRDNDHNVVVAVTVQPSGKGTCDIGVSIAAATPDATPPQAVVTLLSSLGGAEKTSTKEGKVSFASNPPGTYTIEIEVAEGAEKGQTWRLPLTLESA